MARPFPRKTTPATIPPDPLDACAAAYNLTPRKCLGFQTPAEAFLSQLLHFKCESISRPAPGWRGGGEREDGAASAGVLYSRRLKKPGACDDRRTDLDRQFGAQLQLPDRLRRNRRGAGGRSARP